MFKDSASYYCQRIGKQARDLQRASAKRSLSSVKCSLIHLVSLGKTPAASPLKTRGLFLVRSCGVVHNPFLTIVTRFVLPGAIPCTCNRLSFGLYCAWIQRPAIGKPRYPTVFARGAGVSSSQASESGAAFRSRRAYSAGCTRVRK